MDIDHLVYAVPHLGDAIEDLEERLGVRAAPGGKHVGLGTHNALAALGPAVYLEVIAPDPDAPAPTMRRPFGLDELTEPRLAAWAVAVDDIETAIARARAAGFDPGDDVALERVNAEGVVLRCRLTVNALDGGPIPFLIDWADSEHPALNTPQGLVLEHFEIESPDPATVEATLAAIGVVVQVEPARRWALVARIRGPKDLEVLR